MESSHQFRSSGLIRCVDWPAEHTNLEDLNLWQHHCGNPRSHYVGMSWPQDLSREGPSSVE